MVYPLQGAQSTAPYVQRPNLSGSRTDFNGGWELIEMAVSPTDWNVVVAGFWNPAILTPAGIAKRLFGLPEGTPILVEVPMDQLLPYRVKHEGVTITAEMGRLTIVTDTPNFNSLQSAMAIAARAIHELPETPFSAAGFNVRYKLDDAPDQLLTSTTPPIDGTISDAGFAIESRSIKRSLTFNAGILNLEIQSLKNSEVRIEFNFHRQERDKARLIEWLTTPIDEVKATVGKIMSGVAHLEYAEGNQ